MNDNDAAFPSKSDGRRNPPARLRSNRRVVAGPSQRTITRTATRASPVAISDAIADDSDSDDGFIDYLNNCEGPASDDTSNPDTNEEMATFSANMGEEIKVPNAPENVSGKIWGGNGGAEDQIPQEVRHAPGPSRTVLDIDPAAPDERSRRRASAETLNDNQDHNCEYLRRVLEGRAAIFETTQAAVFSLCKDSVALQKERQDMLSLREQAGNECDKLKQRGNQLWTGCGDNWSEADATEMSEICKGMFNASNKRRTCDESLATIEAKKAKCDADIMKYIAANEVTNGNARHAGRAEVG